MSVPNSFDELLSLIRKSGMVDEPKLNAWMQRRSMGRSLPDDPREATDLMVEDGILTNFQAEQFLLGKWRGFTIGKFKLLERIGVGGMGQVFLCEHMFMRRRVAIKVLPPAKAEHPAALGRFYREARAAGLLEHPHIVRTHDIDQDGNLHYIVMEYVDGSNLLEIVKKFGPMSIDRAVGYTRQVAEGLEYAFKNGIIHRDVKPGNVLVDRRGMSKVLDMGLARFFKDQSDNLTVKYDDKIVLGTADYVAPEQVANSHNVDVRADVYALGATLYFLLAGHPPFPTGTVSQKLIWHRTKEPTPIQQIRPEVPDEVAAIVRKMMMKSPAERYQTPGEAAAALAPFAPQKLGPPPLAEMPILCSAVLEGQSTTDTVSDVDRVEQPAEEPVLVAAGGSASRAIDARAGHKSGSKAFPAYTGGSTPPVAPVSPFGRDHRLASPFSNPRISQPLADPLQLPPVNQSTPNRGSSVPLMPLPAPFVSEPLPGSDLTRRNSAAAIALIAICLVIAGCLMYWKFVKS